MIPQLYFDYLRSGDARPLVSVFYHNAMDVLSLAALFGHTAELLADPFSTVEHGVDLVALGKLFEDMGDTALAARLYLVGLERDLPREILLDAIHRLAMIHKRQDNLDTAVGLWQQAAGYAHIQAHIELAKLYEHRFRDPLQASQWTQSAIEIIRGSALPAFERRQWLDELGHRKERLQRKLANHNKPGVGE
jgi:hypothetical protein